MHTQATGVHAKSVQGLIVAVAAIAMIALSMVAINAPSASAQATSTGQVDDTAGVYLYSAGGDTQGFLSPPPGPCAGDPATDPTNVTIQTAIDAGALHLLGDDTIEVTSYTQGDTTTGERNGGTPDTTTADVTTGLASINDYGSIANGSDDDANVDAETGGSVTLQLHVDGAPAFIVPDGATSVGVLGSDPAAPFANLDGAEIFIFEDAELSGYSVDLYGPDGLGSTPYTVAVDDFQRNPDTLTAADDTLVAIDLDSLPGFAFDYVTFVTITDDGIPVPGSLSSCPLGPQIDTSLEIDAVATRTDTVVVGVAGVDVEKTTNGDQADVGAGQNIVEGSAVTWEYTVTNTGTLPLINVTVVDSMGEAVDCGDGTATIASMDIGAVVVCTATGVAQLGPYTNTATVTGQGASASGDPIGDPVTDSDPSAYTGTPAPNPSLDIEKDTNGDQADTGPGLEIEEGQAVTWTYVVTNDGNVDVTSITVSDDQGVAITCPSGNPIPLLTPGATETCTGTGVAVIGAYENTATASGLDPSGNPTSDDDRSAYTGVIAPAPSLDVEKDTNGDQADTGPGEDIEVGEAVTWTYVVTNDGNVPLTDVTLVDDQGVTITCPSGNPIPSLAVDATETCTATGVAVEGAYENTVTATGTDPDGTVAEDDDRSAYTGFFPPASLGDFVWDDLDADGMQDANEPGIGDVMITLLSVAADGSTTAVATQTTDDSGFYMFDDLDSTLTYQVQVVPPTGSILTDADVGDDDGMDSDVDPATGLTGSLSLPPGGSNMTLDIGVTPAPARLGNFLWFDRNTDGIQDADEPGIADATVNLWSVGIDGTPGAILASTTTASNGEYIFANVDSTQDYFVEFVVDDVYTFTSLDAGPDDTDSDVDTNSGISPLINVVRGGEDLTIDAGVLPLIAELDIVKTTSGDFFNVGDPVTWTYVVTNTGNVGLDNVTVDDNIEGRICVIPTLDVGEQQTCTKDGVAVAGNYENTADATGTPNVPNPDGSPVPAPNDSDSSSYEGTEVLPQVLPSPTPVPPTATPVPTSTPVPTATPTPIPQVPLAVTGSSSSNLAVVAGGLLMAGGLLVVAGRRRAEVTVES